MCSLFPPASQTKPIKACTTKWVLLLILPNVGNQSAVNSYCNQKMFPASIDTTIAWWRLKRSSAFDLMRYLLWAFFWNSIRSQFGASISREFGPGAGRNIWTRILVKTKVFRINLGNNPIETITKTNEGQRWARKDRWKPEWEIQESRHNIALEKKL